MIVLPRLDDRQLGSVLGRASPVTKLGVSLAWLSILVTVVDPRPAAVILGASIGAATLLGRIPGRRFLAAWAPFAVAALLLTISNLVFGAANADLTRSELARIGPFRLTEAAAAVAAAIGLRILAIAAVGVAVAQTTEGTALVDSLVQQTPIPDRFAHGALAAYLAVPRLALDLATLRQARRIRGLRASWHPRLLFALLVLAVRRADRLALAMDARGFDSPGQPTRYREVRWSRADAIVVAAGAAVAVLALLAAR